MKSPLISRHACLVLLSLVVASFPRASAQPDVSAQPRESMRPNRAEQLASQAVAQPALAQIDRVRLREVFRLGDSIGDRVWPGWSKAPFAVLLVTPEYEFLVRYTGQEETSRERKPRQKRRQAAAVQIRKLLQANAVQTCRSVKLRYSTGGFQKSWLRRAAETDVYYR